MLHSLLFIPELLRKDLLPNLHPFLLQSSEWFTRTLERARQDIAQSRAQYLDYEHGLPI